MIKIVTVELAVSGNPRDSKELNNLWSYRANLHGAQKMQLNELQHLLGDGYKIVSTSNIVDEIGIFSISKVVYILHKEG